MSRLATQSRSSIRLIATDLDGTLVHSEGTVSAANLAALQAARAAGITIVVCTGRRHSYAMRAARRGVLQPDEVIISTSGAVTRTVAGHLFWRETLSADLTRRLCAVLQDYRNALVLTFDRNEPDGSDAPGALAIEELDTLHSSIQRWMELNAASLKRYTRVEDALDDQGELPVQAMLCGGLDRMRAAEALIQARFPDELATFRTEYPGKDLCILDILPGTISKGATLTRLARRLNVPMDAVLAIGDNWNDLSMLEAAGNRVIMANAPIALLDLARQRQWQIAPAADADGFADAVLHELASEAGIAP